MQAVGSYKGGRMLFLGLGTGLGSAMIVDGVLEPMELAHLRLQKRQNLRRLLRPPRPRAPRKKALAQTRKRGNRHAESFTRRRLRRPRRRQRQKTQGLPAGLHHRQQRKRLHRRPPHLGPRHQSPPQSSIGTAAGSSKPAPKTTIPPAVAKAESKSTAKLSKLRNKQ